MAKKTEIEKRRKVICGYLTKHPDASAQSVLDHVSKLGYNCKLTTTKIDINEIGFVYDTGLRAYYLPESSSYTVDSQLSQIFSASKTRVVSTLNNSLQTICLKTQKPELLITIQSEILSKYGDDIFGSYIASDLLFLLIIGTNRCKRIHKELRRFRKEVSPIDENE